MNKKLNNWLNLKRKKLIRFIKVFITIFKEEKILREASSLTFVTMLGIIPFTLFLITFFPDIPPLNLIDQLKPLLMQILLPETADLVSTYLDQLFEHQASLNIFNIIILITASYSLLNSINNSFDSILKLEQKTTKRTLGTVLKMFGMVMVGFFVFALLIGTSSLPYFHSFITINFIRQFSNYIIPLVFWFVLTNFAYYFIPNAKIKHRSIWISAACSAVVWFIAKIGFDFFILNLTQMKQVYGILSSFPILLFWIYLNWIFVLSGVIIMAILNRVHKKPKTYDLTAKIQLSINAKVTKDYASHIELSDDKQQQLKDFLKSIL